MLDLMQCAPFGVQLGEAARSAPCAADQTIVAYVADKGAYPMCAGPAAYGAVIHRLREGMVADKRLISGGSVNSRAEREGLIGLLESLRLVKEAWPDHRGSIVLFTSRPGTRENLYRAMNFWQHNGWQTLGGATVRSKNLWRDLISAIGSQPTTLQKAPPHPLSIIGATEAHEITRVQLWHQRQFLAKPPYQTH
jgi:ribonuclease HI